MSSKQLAPTAPAAATPATACPSSRKTQRSRSTKGHTRTHTPAHTHIHSDRHTPPPTNRASTPPTTRVRRPGSQAVCCAAVYMLPAAHTAALLVSAPRLRCNSAHGTRNGTFVTSLSNRHQQAVLGSHACGARGMPNAFCVVPWGVNVQALSTPPTSAQPSGQGGLAWRQQWRTRLMARAHTALAMNLRGGKGLLVQALQAAHQHAHMQPCTRRRLPASMRAWRGGATMQAQHEMGLGACPSTHSCLSRSLCVRVRIHTRSTRTHHMRKCDMTPPALSANAIC